ncbi:MAG: glycosyltransferase [Myxococcales bacterium]|nr:glycosyltransferase [Myxococcales bacterium]
MRSNTSLTVVDVSSFFSTSCGGIKRYYQEKARHLPALGVTCHFVVPGESDRDEPFFGGWLHHVAGPLQPGNAAYRRFSFSSRLPQLLRSLAPDVVEVGSHYLLPTMVRRAFAASPRRPRLVGFFHSHPEQIVQNVTAHLPRRLGTGWLGRRAWSFFARQHKSYASTFVASRHIEAQLVSRRVPGVLRVGLGVDVQTFRPRPKAEGSPNVIYAGRFTIDKELPLLLAAFDQVHTRTGAGLTLVGDGPLKGRVRQHAASRPWMRVLDYVASVDDMARLLSESTAVVVPSQTETFSFTTAEALASGVPVVGADRGAVRELVEDSGGGVLFKAGEARGLAHALEGLLAAPAGARTAMGAAGRAHIVKDFTWPAVCERLRAAYDDVIHPGSSPAGASAAP